MQTMFLKVDPHQPNPRIIEIAAAMIRNGEVVAFPTETVYGVGADALSERAVGRIFAAKDRPMDNPLLLHVDSWEQAAELVYPVSDEALVLVKRFWPGPLTFVARARGEVPEIVRSGLPTVGLRMPDHQVALDLIRASGRPIAATSANKSGHPSPIKAEHVKHDLEGRISAIIDGGETGWGIESTIIDIAILRVGAVSWERLNQALPGMIVLPSTGESLGRAASAQDNLGQQLVPFAHGAVFPARLKKDLEGGRRIGMVIMTEHDLPAELDYVRFIRGGSREYARTLYDIFRAAVSHQVDVLYMEMPPEDGLGIAVADRIMKSSGDSQG